MKSPHLLSCTTALIALLGFANYTLAESGVSSSPPTLDRQADGPAKNGAPEQAVQDVGSQAVFFPASA